MPPTTVVLSASAYAADEPVISNEPPSAEAIPSPQERLRELADELGDVAKRHGADSVALQVGLLLNSLRAGAVGPSQVSVVGDSRRAGSEYLEVDVTTGLIFDAESTTRRSHFVHLWRHVAEPTLSGMKSFDMRPPGLDLVFFYGLQPFSLHLERRADPSKPSEPRELRMTIPAQALADLASGRITTDTLLERSVVYEGTEVVPLSDLRQE